MAAGVHTSRSEGAEEPAVSATSPRLVAWCAAVLATLVATFARLGRER
jgi:hypothetical protein